MYLWISEIRYFTYNYHYFLLLNSLLLSFLFLLSVIKIIRSTRTNIIFIIFSYYSMFFMKSIEINIVRQGLAIVSLLLSYQYLISKKKKAAIFYTIASLFFHYTSIVPIILFCFIRSIKKLNINFFIFIFLLFLNLFFIRIRIK